MGVGSPSSSSAVSPERRASGWHRARAPALTWWTKRREMGGPKHNARRDLLLPQLHGRLRPQLRQTRIFRKLDGIKGYIVTDIEAFPSVPYWMLKRESPRVQHKDSRERVISLIKSLPDVSPTESRV